MDWSEVWLDPFRDLGPRCPWTRIEADDDWEAQGCQDGTCFRNEKSPHPRGRGPAQPQQWPLLFVSVGDSAPGEVVRRQLTLHSVAFQHADVVLAHLARQVGQHLVPVFELNAKRRVGKHLTDCALDFDRIFSQRTVSLFLKVAAGLPYSCPPGWATGSGPPDGTLCHTCDHIPWGWIDACTGPIQRRTEEKARGVLLRWPEAGMSSMRSRARPTGHQAAHRRVIRPRPRPLGLSGVPPKSRARSTRNRLTRMGPILKRLHACGSSPEQRHSAAGSRRPALSTRSRCPCGPLGAELHQTCAGRSGPTRACPASIRNRSR